MAPCGCVFIASIRTFCCIADWGERRRTRRPSSSCNDESVPKCNKSTISGGRSVGSETTTTTVGGAVKCSVCKCPSESGSRNMYIHLMPPEVKQLHIAVMRNDLRTVERLVHEKVDVNFPWVSEPNSCSVKHGISPLCEAVALNHTAIALKLIESGAHVNEVDAKGMTPLCRACHFGNEKLARRLVLSGARVNLSRDIEKSPLWFAILCLTQCKAGLLPEYASVIRILLDAGAEVKLPNAVGKSPLHFVCSYMIAPIIPIFIEYGANVDMTDIDFRTPLYDCMTYTGHAPYSKSVQRHRQYAVAEQLIEAGCDDLDLAIWIDRAGVLEEIEACCPVLHKWCALNIGRPLMLKNLCRLAIHAHFGGVFQTALCVSYLQLPLTLTQYLCRKTFSSLSSVTALNANVITAAS